MLTRGKKQLQTAVAFSLITGSLWGLWGATHEMRGEAGIIAGAATGPIVAFVLFLTLRANGPFWPVPLLGALSLPFGALVFGAVGAIFRSGTEWNLPSAGYLLVTVPLTVAYWASLHLQTDGEDAW
jgi:hypothetical protein